MNSNFILGMVTGLAVGMFVATTCPKVNCAIKKFKNKTAQVVSEKCDECKEAVNTMANQSCTMAHQSCCQPNEQTSQNSYF